MQWLNRNGGDSVYDTTAAARARALSGMRTPAIALGRLGAPRCCANIGVARGPSTAAPPAAAVSCHIRRRLKAGKHRLHIDGAPVWRFAAGSDRLGFSTTGWI